MRFNKICAAMLAGMLIVSAVQYKEGLFLVVTEAAGSRVSVHDPSVVKDGDGYYIIGSHLAAARSNDLINWTYTANSNLGTKNTTFFNNIYTDLAVPAKWSDTTDGYDLSGNLWAPDIVYNKKLGKYCMYLSVNGNNWNSSIVLCTADNIDGPYTYKDTIVYSGFTNNSVNNVNDTDVPKVLGSNPDISRYLSGGAWNAMYGTNAIDPAVFYDNDGNLKMIYGSWFGGIFMLELDEETGLRDYNITYDTKTNVSDAYMGKKIAGGYWNSGEGPYIEYMRDPKTGKGYYYLFMSYGFFNSNGGYNMRIFRSTSPDGPYVDQNGNSAIYTAASSDAAANTRGTVGERLMSNYKWSCNDRPYKAQGHNSVLMDDDGKLYVIYHTKFDDSYGLHEVRVHQLFVNEDGWVTAAPYEYSGEKLSAVGHSMSAVAGEYELLFHTLDQAFVNETSADIETPKSVTLGTDGTVKGDLTGMWTMENGSPYMTFTSGGVTYKGVFVVQADESSAAVTKMTFTATGSNTCVWGSKKTAYSTAEDMPDVTDENSLQIYSADKSSGYGSSVYIGDTGLLSGVPYYISNVNSGLMLDLDYGKTDEHTNIQQWEKLGGSPQQWRLTAVKDGYCKIASMVDESKCLAVAENSAANGLNIELETYSGADNQLWKFVGQGAQFGIVSKCSDDTAGLDVFEWSAENGGNINQWQFWGGDCQLWTVKPVYPLVNDGAYTVRNINSGYFISDNGTTAVQSEAEALSFERQSDGTYLISTVDNKYLTVENGSSDNGADIKFAAKTDGNAQRFTLYTNADGSYSLITADGKGCVDVYGISMADGANLCRWEYWGGAGQRFVTEPAEKTVKAGDINSSGIVDNTDAALLLRHISGIELFTDTTLADCNNDGDVNMKDVLFILNSMNKG